MFRPATRAALQSAARSQRPLARAPSATRFLSTAPPTQKSRSWKSSFVRWGLAIGAVYYYNTSNVFADQPEYTTLAQNEQESEQLPTIEAIAAEKRAKLAKAQAIAAQEKQKAAAQAQTDNAAAGGSPEALEEEAGQQGAFNPETGEINWDCPCLGGMAHGPCGEEFKAAFSCFVYSKEEPKGVECIDKFKGMQDCFRKYPEIYGEELDDDDDDDVTKDGADAPVAQESKTSESNSATPNERAEKTSQDRPTLSPEEIQAKRQRAQASAKSEAEKNATADGVPQPWHSSK
ncbi:intermembrane space protein [Phyllosticta citriasiana]|uniref:Mitochondrial intermembrane space import and assembly protein 40 n=1 Tax=Phyllosticta citriasiana TaxID=595635 RepID=A0ABR1KWN8_9PEZI